uniref:NADH dehydrogenase subunit 6 n=1 Tax=Dermestes vorax TaxID=2571047 RepID=UPI003003128C|nr:NADH dehydrogenase subunit 6 [Dermestes vorax]
MAFTTILFFMIIMSFLLIITKHPMSMGTTLLFQTILMTMNAGYFNHSFWYSYIIFLVMIGGLLILFIYMTSVASNEKFKFPIKSFIIIPISFTMMMLFTNEMFMNSFMWNKSEMLNILTQNNQILSMSKFFNEPFIMIMMMMMIYLLISLIAVVKITNIKHGTLRQKF